MHANLGFRGLHGVMNTYLGDLISLELNATAVEVTSGLVDDYGDAVKSIVDLERFAFERCEVVGRLSAIIGMNHESCTIALDLERIGALHAMPFPYELVFGAAAGCEKKVIERQATARGWRRITIFLV